MHGEDLDGAQGRVDVRVVARVRGESACADDRVSASGESGRGGREGRTDVGVPAREDPGDHVVLWEGILAAEEGECGEAPVDAVDAEVLGVVVAELVALLQCGGERVRVR